VEFCLGSDIYISESDYFLVFSGLHILGVGVLFGS